MTLVLVAHGTRDPAGVALARRLAATMGARLAFVDVLGPALREVLAEVAGPVTVVPAFLAAGYHVHVDVPREVAASGRDDVTVTEALGPHSAVVSAVTTRLGEAGWRRGDAVVLAAAGSSDSRAVADVHAAAQRLSMSTGRRVRVGYLATGTPRLRELVGELRATGRRRVAVGCWLLAPGRFHRAATDCGADVVAEPLGTHPAVLGRLSELAGSHGRHLVAAHSCGAASGDSIMRYC
ncbi:MAG: sirohydrochlorin chelatase [Pseudonocardiaceae bacterium]|nr:sirohydrochlorin chelatase [Pseudonocardiaceae bacterium]